MSSIETSAEHTVLHGVGHFYIVLGSIILEPKSGLSIKIMLLEATCHLSAAKHSST